MLEINDLYVGYYEDLHILRGLSLTAQTGKLTAILGANGVGKSTLLKAVYGFLKPHSGQVLLKWQQCHRHGDAPTHQFGNQLYSAAARRLQAYERSGKSHAGRLDLPKRQEANREQN